MASFADFDFYRNSYKGILVTSDLIYSIFAERAGDELALFANRIPNDDEAQNALKRCACALADCMYGDYKMSKEGTAKIASESVSGYYSVSYSTPTYGQVRTKINNIIALYLGKYILGARKVMM